MACELLQNGKANSSWEESKLMNKVADVDEKSATIDLEKAAH